MGSSKIRETRSWLIIGPNGTLQGLEEALDLERALPNHRLSCLHSGQVEQVVDQGR